ncbi:MAG: YdcF family protein [Deltaproteobacteria bacterium]|nr:YdcF family protein [Deltaproteobacteria bacterium]
MTLDCLIVLGASLNPQGKPGRLAKMRLLHALEVWRSRCPGAFFIISGGVVGGNQVSEARAMAEWALNWVGENWGAGVREQLRSCLLLEEASRNTAASAVHTLPLLKKLNLKSVGLVSDALHLRRARYLFRRHFRGRRIALHSCPAPGIYRSYWVQRRYLRLGKMFLREGGAWLKALARRTLGR